MDNKTKNLIDTLTSNIKRSTHIEEIEKVNAELAKSSDKKFLGKPKNIIYKNKPRTNKHAKYYIRSSNPNKIEY